MHTRIYIYLYILWVIVAEVKGNSLYERTKSEEVKDVTPFVLSVH